jgi:Tol biopolymer transport system component
MTTMFAAAIVGLSVVGCTDAASPYDSAAINVRVTVAGVYPLDGFSVQVDGSPMTLPRTDASLIVRGLSSGAHTVALVGMPANCQSDGDNPATVETSFQKLSNVEFHVSCLATTGVIAVAMTVSGYDKPIQLAAQVDSTFVGYAIVSANRRVSLDHSYSAGSHVVQLSAIPHFCEPAGELSASVDVKTGGVTQDTVVASFSITCQPPEPGADTTATIAFERDKNVMLVDEAGHSTVVLTEGAHPAWSPDGKLIAFEKFTCDLILPLDCDADLWLTEPTGNNKRPIIARTDYYDFDPAISPDGKQIAFGRQLEGLDELSLGVANLDGSSARNLAVWDVVGSPTWSRDGAKIAFSCFRNGSVDLCIVDMARSCTGPFDSYCGLPNPTRLLAGSGERLDPAWSPDGRRIALTLQCTTAIAPDCPGDIQQGEPYVAVVDPATGVVTKLVAGHDAAWSGDGSQLVYAGNASAPGLRIYNFADGSVRQLTNNPADSSPAWRE